MHPELDFRRLKERVSIEMLLEQRGLLDTLRPRGDKLVGPCPVHGGDNPSAFVVDRHRDLWHCFTRCQGGGDLIELVRRLEGIGYHQAAIEISKLVGHRTPPRRPTSAAPPSRIYRPYRKRLDLDPCHPFLGTKGIRAETADRFEVGAWSGRGMLEDCIAVRLRDPRGRPLGYAGRRVHPDDRGKWVFPPRMPKSRLLYQYHRLLRDPAQPVVLVEGPWGVLRLAQLGIPAVALLGVHMSDEQAHLLRSIRRVNVMLDGDPAGRQATEAICRRLDAVEVTLADGRDPDDMADEDLATLLCPSLLF